MPEPLVGILGIFALLILFAAEVPIAFAMAIVGFLGFAGLTSVDAALSVVARDIFSPLSAYALTSITTFVAMGAFALNTGITRRLFDASFSCVGEFPGGLAISSILASSGFAAICGSPVATAATVGKVALPEMRGRGYDRRLAAGCIAAGGTLGIMIPPSNMMIVYGVLTQEAIGKLFIAGILPGAVLTVLFVAVVSGTCRRNPKAGPPGPHTTWPQKFRSLYGLIDVCVLFSLIIGGLFAGFFTPTQAGSIGVAGALGIGAIRRELDFRKLYDACRETVITSCMILFIIAGAEIFGHFIAVSMLPSAIATLAVELHAPRLVTMLCIVAVYFVGGCFIDILPLVLLTLPIFYPIVRDLGYDPYWFCIIIVLISQAGVITPPVGVNAFVVHGLQSDISVRDVFSGAMPFLAMIAVLVVLMFLFPDLATFLPSLASY